MDKFISLLHNAGCSYRVINHDKVVTMDDVQKTLGIPYTQMAKTLIVEVKKKLYGVVLQGKGRLNKLKLSTYLDIRRKDIKFPSKEVIEENLGVEVGGIPPFGLDIPVLIDQQLTTLDFIYCGCGLVTSTLEIKVEDLIKVANARIVDVAE